MKIYHTKLKNDGRNNHAGVGGGDVLGVIRCRSVNVLEMYKDQ